jgi:hypothetical protein
MRRFAPDQTNLLRPVVGVDVYGADGFQLLRHVVLLDALVFWASACQPMPRLQP